MHSRYGVIAYRDLLMVTNSGIQDIDFYKSGDLSFDGSLEFLEISKMASVGASSLDVGRLQRPTRGPPEAHFCVTQWQETSKLHHERLPPEAFRRGAAATIFVGYKHFYIPFHLAPPLLSQYASMMSQTTSLSTCIRL